MKKVLSYAVVVYFTVFFSYLIAGEYSFDFLDIGIGTRSRALGCTFVSIADDGASVFWNPAGTSLMQSSQFYFTHNANFGGLSTLDYISFIKPLLAKSSFSFAFIRHNVGEIPIFPELEGTSEERDTTPSIQGDGIPIGYFDESASVFIVNFSKSLFFSGNRLNVGCNFKYLNESIYSFNGTGIGVDIGFIIAIKQHLLPGQLTFGVSMKDASGTQIIWNTKTETKDIVLSDYRLGVSYKKKVNRINSSFMFAVEHSTRYDNNNHIGLEYTYKNHFLIDGGWNSGSFSIGTGFRFWKITIQYGFIPNAIGSSHSVSMTFTL